MAKNTSAPEIWHKIIKAFDKTGLEYVLVGGVALIIHGLPRSTLDIDIYVPAKEEILSKLFKIADSLGLQSEQGQILALGSFPSLFTGQWICFSDKGKDILDIFLSSEKEFDRIYSNSESKRDRDISVRVASLKDIEAMKRSSGRPIDLADIEFIKEAKKYRK